MKGNFLPAEDIPGYWPKIAPLLGSVVDEACHGEFTVGDLFHLALNNHIMIFVCKKEDEIVLAAALEFRCYPQKQGMNVLAIGGKHFYEGMSCFFDTIKAGMAETGATFVEASCSQAMARMLARYGFMPVYQQVRLNLERRGGEDDFQ